MNTPAEHAELEVTEHFDEEPSMISAFSSFRSFRQPSETPTDSCPPAHSEDLDEKSPCPHCGRKFTEIHLAKHAPVCHLALTPEGRLRVSWGNKLGQTGAISPHGIGWMGENTPPSHAPMGPRPWALPRWSRLIRSLRSGAGGTERGDQGASHVTSEPRV